jgi:RNA polymerase sigma-70 factor (ECF subfamily)
VSRPADPFEAELLATLPKVRACARSLVRSAQGADDLVQDTVERGLRYRDSFEMGTNMAGWLCFICRNLFLSERRRAWRSVAMADGQAERVPTRASAHHLVELKELLDAMSFLPEPQREALLTISMSSDGEDYESAAALLGTQVGTVKSRVSRGRDALEAFFRTA